MSIQITYELQKSELECYICYDDISPPIIQCSSGNHFVCHSCKQKIHSKCPICRTSKLFIISCSRNNCHLTLNHVDIQSAT